MIPPTRDQFTDANQVIIRITPGAVPDAHNRVQFTAWWLTDQPWVPSGVRGQIFRADVAQFAASQGGAA